METKNTNGVHVQNGIAKEVNNKAAQNGVAAKENGSHPKGNASSKPESEKQKPDLLKDEKPEVHQPGQPKPEEAKHVVLQVKEEIKPVLNLEAKLKVVNDLHRKSTQRINLISRIGQLEAFEVKLASENDELEDNPYQGCKLIIRDDKNREFVTTTPGLIRLVSQFIFGACHEKLAEIEASIVFPNS